jgi:UDPglucose 6-dehydrogenase
MSAPESSTGVSVVGLGKLGACIAACFADRGFKVVGVDVSQRTIDLVNQGSAPVFEPGLQDLMTGARANLRATGDYRDAIRSTDATLIVVPTPSEDHGGFSLRYAVEAARSIGRVLRDKPGYHLVVLTSTVLPGSTEYAIKPVLEAESGKRCGVDFGLCYSPEFIALGSVIRDFLKPDFLLIGESDEDAGARLAELYSQVVDAMPPVARMNFVNAELAKISVNTYVTMKISFANMLAALCEQLPGGDVDKVTGALGLDTRIGPRYLKGAVGYGGPCFPRDNQALAYLARQLGHPAAFAEATDTFNRGVLDRLTAKVGEHVPTGGTVAILGLSYKPDTNVVEEAQGMLLAARLSAEGHNVVVFDPVAMESARTALGDTVAYAASLEEALGDADVVFITNPDRAYAELEPGALAGKPVVIDAWRLLRKSAEAAGARNYVALGVAAQDTELVRYLSELWSRDSEIVE